MNTSTLPREPDWFLWRSFLMVMDEGSLSGAARALGASQPTIGRHIEELESCLSAVLFDRTGRGLKPTTIALQLVEPVRNAKSALAEAQLAVTGATQVLDGTVRITASQIISHHILPLILKKAREIYPMIELEIVPSDSVENLLLREADIAIRMFRPGQLDVVGKKIGEVPLVACASKSYLDKHGYPEKIKDMYDHEIVGLDRQDDIVTIAKILGFTLERSDFKLRSDSHTLIWEMVKQGLGISFAQEYLVAQTPGMVAILPELKIPSMEMWLVAHREVHKANRIRVIYDLLATELSAYTG